MCLAWSFVCPKDHHGCPSSPSGPDLKKLVVSVILISDCATTPSRDADFFMYYVKTPGQSPDEPALSIPFVKGGRVGVVRWKSGLTSAVFLETWFFDFLRWVTHIDSFASHPETNFPCFYLGRPYQLIPCSNIQHGIVPHHLGCYPACCQVTTNHIIFYKTQSSRGKRKRIISQW